MSECSVRPSTLDTVLNYDDDSELVAALEASISDWNVFFNDTEVNEKDILHNELKRLQALKSSGILNLNRKVRLEHFTALAARIFDVPISLVSIVDLGRVWLASNLGFGHGHETPRISSTICSHAIQSLEDVFVVPDTLKDARFKNNPLVTGAPHVRFYASSPLITHDGYKIGNMCVIDVKPHSDGISFVEKQNLSDIAALAMDYIESMRICKEESDKLKTKIVATTAHDLITPLSAIQLNMEIMCDDKELMGRMGEQFKNDFHQTKDCVDLLSSICQQAIQSYHESCFSIPTKVVLNDGDDIVDTSKFVSTLRNIMVAYPKRVPLTIRCGEDVPSFIKSDKVSLFRSSINLMTNACKVTKSGFIDFNLHLEPTKGEQERIPMLVFECIDTGPGIEFEDLSHLFSANGGMMLSKKSGNGGSGLGLNSVQELITRIGGQFGYRPRNGYGTGSIFWFSVPTHLNETDLQKKMIKYQDKDDIPNDSEEIVRYIPCKKLKSEEKMIKSAFIIGESIPIRKFLQKALLAHEYRVIEGDNFSQGIQTMKTTRFDLVFCDFLMPAAHGLECVKHYREWEQGHRKSQTCIVGVSAQIDDHDRHLGATSGIDEFISIPFSLRTLHDFLLGKEQTLLQKNMDAVFMHQNSSDQKIDDPICLLVEDCTTVAKAMMNCIKRQNWQVHLAQDGNSALDLLKSRRWNIILMDDQLPIMSGSECVVKFREWEQKENRKFRQNNLFLCSADAHRDDLDLSVVGFDGVLSKPIQMPKLISTLHKCALDRNVT